MSATQARLHALAASAAARRTSATQTPAYAPPAARTNPAVLHLLIWGCAQPLWPEIESFVRARTTIRGKPRHLHLHRPAEFVRAVYSVDDVTPENLDKKVRAIMRCPAEVLSLVIMADPQYRTKAINGGDISRHIEQLKKETRDTFKGRVANYTHDIIIHGSDNEQVHARHMEGLVGIVRTDGACSASNRWACVHDTMERRHVGADDWLVVGSSVLSGLTGRAGHDTDLVVRPAARVRAMGGQVDATIVAEGLQVVHGNWLGRGGSGSAAGGLSDDLLLDDPRWHRLSHGSTRPPIRHVAPELAILKKGIGGREKDKMHLDGLCARPFAWDKRLLAEAAALMGRLASGTPGTPSSCSMADGMPCACAFG